MKKKLKIKQSPDGTIPLHKHPKHEMAHPQLQVRKLDMKSGVGMVFETVVGPPEDPK